MFQAKISCDTPQNHCSTANITGASFSRINLRASFSRIDATAFTDIPKYLGKLRARYRDINTRDHFQVHLKSWALRRTRIRQKCQSRRAPNCFACLRRRRVDRCALVFYRVTYLSILQRTIGFNEVEIENAIARAHDVRGIRLINIAYVWEQSSLNSLRD